MAEVINLFDRKLDQAKRKCRVRLVLKKILDRLVECPEPEYFEPVDFILVELFDAGFVVCAIDDSEPIEVA